MSPNDQEFPALSQLTESVSRRMHELESQELAAERAPSRLRPRRVAGVALAALILGVPTAAAVRNVLGPSAVPFQAPTIEAGTSRVVAGDGVGYVVAEGTTASRAWTIALRRCESDGRVGLGVLTLIGEQPRSGGMGLGACPGPDPDTPGALQPPPPGTSRSRGLTVLYGVVPAQVTSVAVRVQASPVDESGTRGPAEPRTIELPTAALPADAVTDGRLPDNYRVYHTQTGSEDFQIVTATGSDGSGAAILDCTASDCRRSEK